MSEEDLEQKTTRVENAALACAYNELGGLLEALEGENGRDNAVKKILNAFKAVRKSGIFDAREIVCSALYAEICVQDINDCSPRSVGGSAIEALATACLALNACGQIGEFFDYFQNGEANADEVVQLLKNNRKLILATRKGNKKNG